MPPADKQRTIRRRILFTAITLVVAVAAVEVVSAVILSVLDGEMFSYARMRAARLHASGQVGTNPSGVSNTGRDGKPATPRRAIDYYAIHPYLGYVLDREATQQRPANRFGFDGTNDPLIDTDTRQSMDHRFRIGVLGGSVAFDLTEHGVDALQTDLQKSPRFQDRKLVVVNMAVPGFKQPQQLIAFNYLLAMGAQFDAVINVDGFNEVALSIGDNVPRGVHPLYPMNWDLLVELTPDQELQRRIGEIVYLRNRQREVAESFSSIAAAYSVTAQLVWRLRDRSLQSTIAKRNQSLSSALESTKQRWSVIRGPDTDGFDGDQAFDLVADTWARSSKQIADLCRARGIRYLHFLQPNQYDPGAKPIGAAERAIAIHEDPEYRYKRCVEKGYPRLSAKAVELRDAGVRFIDLRRLFAAIEEPLYRDDCCHFNGVGVAIMARRIGQEIRDLYDTENLRMARLEVPQRQLLRSPFDSTVIEVVGEYEDGSKRPLHGAHTGTTYRSDNPAVVSVTLDGELVPHTNGDAVVTVRNGKHVHRVAITVRFDPVTSYGRGVPGSGGRIPELSAAGQEPKIGNPDFGLTATNVLGGAQGWFLVSRSPRRDPLHAYLLVDDTSTRFAAQAMGRPGVPGIGRARIALPIPDDPALRGSKTFWQAVFRDPGAKDAHSASNALMVTVF